MERIFIQRLCLLFINYLILVDSKLVTFEQCLLKTDSKPHNILSCAGQQALNSLDYFNNLNNLTVTDGFLVTKQEEAMGRSNDLNFLDQDPNDFRGMLETAGIMMSERSIHYDMSKFYPGLQLRVGPTAVGGGILEFHMDSNVRYDERHDDVPSTARILTKKYVLPLLLGFKFQLITLMPIILGLIILISKKAAFLSKLALFVSGLVGAGGLFSFGGLGASNYGGGGDYGLHRPYHYNDQHHQHGIYKIIENTPRTQEDLVQRPADKFYDYERQQLIKDRSSRLYERELDDGQFVPQHMPTNQRIVWQTNQKN